MRKPLVCAPPPHHWIPPHVSCAPHITISPQRHTTSLFHFLLRCTCICTGSARARETYGVNDVVILASFLSFEQSARKLVLCIFDAKKWGEVAAERTPLHENQMVRWYGPCGARALQPLSYVQGGYWKVEVHIIAKATPGHFIQPYSIYLWRDCFDGEQNLLLVHSLVNLAYGA